jgi:5-hydroxyisourate hydrolase-like protein (transthyretin family)
MKLILRISALMLLLTPAFGQVDKTKARVSVQYSKIMNQESFISIEAKYKSENGIEPATQVEFQVYQRIAEDSLHQLGTIATNHSGIAKFPLANHKDSTTSLSGNFSFVVKIENDPKFSDAETELTISDANLVAGLETVDSINQITATLTDALGQPVAGQPLRVQLQRMFGPLSIGEESYETDENGTITVLVEEPMPGINGVLTFEVVLNESDEYGTVKAIIDAPIGLPITDHSTFDKRTMWSPPSKTPYYLLIFPNLIILGVWVPILMLIINLFRISRAKTDL